jgi:hypothetical protein
MRPDPSRLRVAIVPERIRCIGGQSFGFIPHRFLRDGFLSALDRDELALYVFLVLAANRDGVSFYGYDAICSALAFTVDHYLAARNGLIAKELLAFDGTRFQVLDLPTQPVRTRPATLTTSDELEEHDPATIRAIVRRQFDPDGDR